MVKIPFGIRVLLVLSALVIVLSGLGGATTDDAARPVVIAHRGASAYLPEHTLAAYAMAFAHGADDIEPDVVMTKDGVLICSHDIDADHTTNAAELFPNRARADGHIYYADLTLDEARRLEVRGRDGSGRGHRIVTLDEMIVLVKHMNAKFGRDVGIVPEIKKPAEHAAAGLDPARELSAVLARHGYSRRSDRAIVQCFDLETLRRMRHEIESDLQMVWLVDKEPTDAQLDDAAAFVDAVSPSRKLLEREVDGRIEPTGLAGRIKSRGLKLYSWTFKDDPEAMARFWTEHNCDGLFTDNPDIGVRTRDRLR